MTKPTTAKQRARRRRALRGERYYDGAAFVDQLDELPSYGGDADLPTIVRRMEISSGSETYAHRRRE